MMKKLKDICEIQYGYAFDSKCFTDDSAYPQLARIRDVKRGYSDTYYSGEYSDEYVLFSGDLLVGMDGEFNISKWMCDGALLNQRVCKLIPKSGINKEYLRFAMSKALKEIENRTSFVTVKHLSAKELNKLELIIPIVDKQNNIADSLVKLENIINKRQQELDKLDELVKARFVEMFGDPESNSMEWHEDALSEHLSVIGGYAFKSDLFDEIKGVPILRIGNINAGFFKPINMVYWKKDEKLEKYSIYPGDLVMSLTGTVGKDDYGNVCIMDDSFEMYYLNQRNAKLELQASINKYYLSYLLKFEQIKAKLTGISRGVRQANISNKDILNLVVPIPPIELQNKFADFVKQIDKSKVAVQKALDEAQLLFDSLMQEYFG